ncbi:MAG: D-xylose transporter ATP-binding protein, partial [Pseudonocardiales bacterium]|nr:D-xylose transporter ATP-binding protein [Pseudonocardiales bacterium]
PGEAHALLGENGSGKSTLMKVAYGELEPTEGEVYLHGERTKFANPLHATRAGVTMVAQEVPVVRSVTVGENIALGRLPWRRGAIDWRRVHRHAAEVLEELESPIDPRRLVSTLGPDDRQIVAIARALAVDARVVIFDEPTSSLTAERVDSLFKIIGRMKERGIAVAFISQRLQDIQPVADRVTVIRDGRLVDTVPIGEADETTITRMMVGRPLNDYFHREVVTVSEPSPVAKSALRVKDLNVEGVVHDVCFDVQPGEVVGLAGLVGSGRVELIRAIFGVQAATGTVEIGGKPFTKRNPRSAIGAGIAMLTSDRKNEGLVLSRSILHNLTMVENNRLSVAPTRAQSQRALAERVIREVQIRPPDPNVLVGKLSGGNQQKVALGRWLARPPKVFLLDEPTRGVDVGAKSEIYRVIRELAARGTAVVISSSENGELLGICDRILMMFRGRVVASELCTELDEWKVAEHVAGVHQDL